MNCSEISVRLGLAPPDEDREITSVVTDSRQAVPGALFVCLPGEHADGHDFARQAQQAGAAAVLASRALPQIDVPVLLVEDTVRALGDMALLWREKTQAVVVGLTGTAGKTTVKELLAHILAKHGKTARNALNYNNQIGLPRSMLATDGDECFWVMEAGISKEGDMEELGAVLRPDLGLILNAGAGHTERLGARGVAAHKSALLQYLSQDGRGLVSADYPDLMREAVSSGAKLDFFSAVNPDVRYYAAYEGPAREAERNGARGRYRLCLDGETITVTAPFRGQYGAENCAAAAAAAHLLGLSAAEIVAGVADAPIPAQRFSRKKIGQWEIIDDTYNANPLSMRRMLDAAVEIADKRALVPVLGEMRELGLMAGIEHEKLGRRLADINPAGVFWKGGHEAQVRLGLEKGGYGGLFFPIRERADFIHALNALLRENKIARNGALLLFKGSRGNRLEEECADICRAFQE
ncbi:MAG: UDP-N-acetylmuramoyl-tripeptide--D-alanyl-D-alanine ligase [Desulfovibrio sp.]|jgi:UDP-N-acetylmuramoyl-tripeptide--D-alanyl-D-alanine ligase|nr:UDP-N-acetylmuramoyl-tripeptide--D-alanyl-D-alanine ligase [Desulfovibrio sp.]